MSRSVLIAAPLALALLGGAAQGVEKAGGKPGSVLPGSTGKEPISVDATRLDYFDKDQKLVYAGGVVARQGTSTLKGSVLTIFLTKDARKAAAEPGSADEPSPAASSSIDRMEVTGPVTVISKDEVGTGDNASYNKAANRVVLTGNVTLTQGTNIIKGDQLVYDMDSGQAHVTGKRVLSIFTPNSSTPSTGNRKAKPTGGANEAAAAKGP